MRSREFKTLEKIDDDCRTGYLAIHEFDFIYPDQLYLTIDGRYWVIQEILSHFWDPNKPMEYYRVVIMRIAEGVDPRLCVEPTEDQGDFTLVVHD